MLARLAMEKVLVVGAGLTGAVTASLLRETLPNGTHIEIWDKSRGSGGRMGTSRSPDDPKSTVDLGAQYISTTPENYKLHERFYNDLQTSDILRPLCDTIEGDRGHPEGTQHFVSPMGIGSVVKHFLNLANTEVTFNQQISHITETDGGWIVSTTASKQAKFDCVVLTMPVPQILQLQGTVKDIIDENADVKQRLWAVRYSARFAVGLFYKPGTQLPVPWSAKYFYEDECIRFVSIDDRKRNKASGEVGPTVCVHTSVPFSLKHLDEDKESVGEQRIMPHLKAVLPQLPAPAAVKNHKWKYSQVHRSYEGQPGAIALSEQPLLVCGGDAFTSSGFDNCIQSALKIVSLIQEHIHGSNKASKV